MTSRERVLAAINHKESDKIPLDIGATPSSGLSVIAYKNLIKYLGKEHLPTHVYDVIQEVAQPPMEILDLMGVDVIDIGRHFNTDPSYWTKMEVMKGYEALYPNWFKVKDGQDGEKLLIGNSTGEVVGIMPEGATFFDQTIFPYLDGYPSDYTDLGHQMTRSVWGSCGFTPWDWANEKDFWKMLREKTIELKQQTDKALLLGIGCNLFEWGTYMRRMDNFFMDLVLEPENVHQFLDRLLESHMNTLKKTVEAVGDVIDIIKFGDDLGSTKGTLMSPDMYREFFQPRHKALCDYVHKNSPMHTMVHSCGSIYDLLPDMIDAGFEIFNPIQLNAAKMVPENLKREFGKDIVFWGGGCDTASILNRATPEEVKIHVKRNCEIFGKDGGFVFAAVHNIMPDVPPQNIMAMIEALNEFK